MSALLLKWGVGLIAAGLTPMLSKILNWSSILTVSSEPLVAPIVNVLSALPDFGEALMSQSASYVW